MRKLIPGMLPSLAGYAKEERIDGRAFANGVVIVRYVVRG